MNQNLIEKEDLDQQASDKVIVYYNFCDEPFWEEDIHNGYSYFVNLIEIFLEACEIPFDMYFSSDPYFWAATKTLIHYKGNVYRYQAISLKEFLQAWCKHNNKDITALTITLSLSASTEIRHLAKSIVHFLEH